MKETQLNLLSSLSDSQNELTKMKQERVSQIKQKYKSSDLLTDYMKITNFSRNYNSFIFTTSYVLFTDDLNNAYFWLCNLVSTLSYLVKLMN